MHALVIFLQKDLNRKLELITKLEELKFKIILIEGLDGSKIDPNDSVWLNYKKLAEKRYNRKIHINEFACLSSHIRAMNFVLEHNLENYIIFEDDAIIKSNTIKPTNKLDNNSLLFYGGLEGLDIQKLNIWSKSVFDSYSCVNIKFVQRACGYQLGQNILKWYVNNMINQGVINDDWYFLYKSGILTELILIKKCAHPEINVSHIVERKLSNLGITFLLKRLVFNILNFKNYSYKSIPYVD